jgi:phosphoribosylformylglycinamidine synthase
MASESFSESAEQRRPTVQVGDPFKEKLLLEACLELMALDPCPIVGIQDMGAAGLTSSAVEMAARAGTGIFLNLGDVPLRETKMAAHEIMLSESQERMLVVLKPGMEREAKQIFDKWGLDFCSIGIVTDTGRIQLLHDNKEVADIPIEFLADDAPTYERPLQAPTKGTPLDLNQFAPDKLGKTLNDVFMEVISSPNLSSRRWIWEQYDYMVGTGTVLSPGLGASVIRVDDSGRSVAISVDCNSRYCKLDPKEGAKLAVAECARNLACVGATPVAVTDCLNFGNPENPEVMWEFSQAVDGITEACNELGLAVVSGNVSLYNETDGASIHPTPTVALVGVFDTEGGKPPRMVPHWGRNHGDGDLLFLVGETLPDDFGGSEYLSRVAGEASTHPPRLDWEKEKAVQDLVRKWILRDHLVFATDLSEGGLAGTLAGLSDLMTFRLWVGVKRFEEDEALGMDPWQFLFSESPSRILVCVPPILMKQLPEEAEAAKVPMTFIGTLQHPTYPYPALTWRDPDTRAALLEVPWEDILQARQSLTTYMEE